MELRDLTKLEQFAEYYKEKNLQTISAKIDHLKEVMKIRAVRYEYGATQDEMLMGLEDSALLGSWRNSNQ